MRTRDFIKEARLHVRPDLGTPSPVYAALKREVSEAKQARGANLGRIFNHFYQQSVDITKAWQYPFPEHPLLTPDFYVRDEVGEWLRDPHALRRAMYRYDLKKFSEAWERHPSIRTEAEHERIVRFVRFVRKVERFITTFDGYHYRAQDWANIVSDSIERGDIKHVVGWPCVFRPVLFHTKERIAFNLHERFG